MKSKKKFLHFLLLAIVFIFVGCTSGNEIVSSEEVVIMGLPDGDINMAIEEIKSFKSYNGQMKGETSEGEILEFDIKGTNLGDILEQNGCKQEEYSGIRIIASDGYTIEVPRSILLTKSVILAYEVDGKALDADSAPIHVFIPDERSMYWVRMVNRIELLNTTPSDIVSGVFIMESLYNTTDYEEYSYNGKNHMVLNTKRIINSHKEASGDVITMLAADDFIKNETIENFFKGSIKMIGENTPQFFSSELPEGMFVNNLVLFKYDGQAFVFIAKALEKYKTLNLQTLVELCSLQVGKGVVISVRDGKTMVIAEENLHEWRIFCEPGEGAYIKKEDGNGTLIHVLSIKNN